MWRNWRSVLGFRTPERRRRKPLPAVRSCELAVELLEPRSMLTTFLVDSLADNVEADGLVTLREAISAANDNQPVADAPAGSVGLDLITFAPQLGGQTISLSEGTFWIWDDLEITGPATGPVTLDAGGRTNHLFVWDADLTLSQLRFSEGYSNNSDYLLMSGAIDVHARSTLRVSDTEFVHCVTDGNGGAIHAYGDVEIDRCVFRDCQAGCGGAVFVSTGHRSSPVIRNSTFLNNSVFIHGGAVFVHRGLGDSLIQGCRFEDNRGYTSGAVAVHKRTEEVSLVRVLDSTFLNNEAVSHSGALSVVDSNVRIQNCIFDGNSASDPDAEDTGDGGAIKFEGVGSSLLTGSRWQNNRAERNGGAIFVSATSVVAIHDSTFYTNQAEGNQPLNGGGAIFNNGGVLRVFRGDLATNTAWGTYGAGGAIRALGGQTVVKYATTFELNAATISGGAVEIRDGVGIFEQVEFGTLVFGNGAAFRSDDPNVLRHGRGGALSIISQTQQAQVFVRDCNFRLNQAGSGGAIFVGQNSMLWMRGLWNNLLNNESSLRGGAILVAGQIRFEGRTDIARNRARIAGGGIFATPTAILEGLSYVQFDSNTPDNATPPLPPG